MPFKKLLDDIVAVIATLGKTTAAQNAILELEKQSPVIAKAIKDGLSVADAISQAQQLQKENQKAMKIIPISAENANIIFDLDAELKNAQKNYEKAMAKRSGRKYSRSSKSTRAKIDSDVKIAKVVVDQIQSDLNDAYDDFIKSTYTLGQHAISILNNYKTLKKTIQKTKQKSRVNAHQADVITLKES